MRRITAFVGMLALLLAVVPGNGLVVQAQTSVNTAKIGVLAYRGTSSANSRWRPLVTYLNSAVSGWKFEIVPVTQGSVAGQIENRKLDFIVTNPGHYVALQKLYGLSALATRERLSGQFLPGRMKFGSVIFTRSDSAVLSFGELRGKTLAAVSPDAFGGFQIAWRELKQQGVDPFKDLKAVRFMGFPQDAIIAAVRSGKVEAGVVRSGLLELLASEGRFGLDEFRVLNASNQQKYIHLLSSKLYPEWPFAALPSTGKVLREKVLVALMATQDAGVVKTFGLSDIWSAPLSYDDVRELVTSYGEYAAGNSVGSQPLFAGRGWNVLAVFLSLLALVVLVYVLATRRKSANPGAERSGGARMPPEMLARFDDLTKREREVLCLICQGFSSKVVADKLGISTKTVEFHRANLLQKTQAGTTPRLVQLATQAGLDKARKIVAI